MASSIGRTTSIIFLYYIWYSGIRGGAVGWGTALQDGRSRVRFPVVSLVFIIDISSSRSMALGLTQPLMDMSIFLGGGAVRRADNLTTFMCRLSWNLRASTSWNPQGLSRPVLVLLYYVWYSVLANDSQPRMILGLYVESRRFNSFSYLLTELHPGKTTVVSEAQECSHEVYNHASFFPSNINLLASSILSYTTVVNTEIEISG